MNLVKFKLRAGDIVLCDPQENNSTLNHNSINSQTPSATGKVDKGCQTDFLAFAEMLVTRREKESTKILSPLSVDNGACNKRRRCDFEDLSVGIDRDENNQTKRTAIDLSVADSQNKARLPSLDAITKTLDRNMSRHLASLSEENKDLNRDKEMRMIEANLSDEANASMALEKRPIPLEALERDLPYMEQEEASVYEHGFSRKENISRERRSPSGKSPVGKKRSTPTKKASPRHDALKKLLTNRTHLSDLSLKAIHEKEDQDSGFVHLIYSKELMAGGPGEDVAPFMKRGRGRPKKNSSPNGKPTTLPLLLPKPFDPAKATERQPIHNRPRLPVPVNGNRIRLNEVMAEYERVMRLSGQDPASSLSRGSSIDLPSSANPASTENNGETVNKSSKKSASPLGSGKLTNGSDLGAVRKPPVFRRIEPKPPGMQSMQLAMRQKSAAIKENTNVDMLKQIPREAKSHEIKAKAALIPPSTTPSSSVCTTEITSSPNNSASMGTKRLRFAEQMSRRGSSRLRAPTTRTFSDPSLMFPPVLLPEAHWTRFKPKARTHENAIQVIREFFNSPIAGFGPSIEADYGNDLCGVLLEFNLRKLVGANVGGYFSQFAGLKDEQNPFLKSIYSEFALRGMYVKRKYGTEAPLTTRDLYLSTEDSSLTEFSSDDFEDDSEFRSAKKARKSNRKQTAPKPGDLPWGELAKMHEAEWGGPAEVLNLYSKKRFQEFGLYYDPALGHHEEEQEAKFKFPLPIFYGEEFINTEEDFELPYDVWRCIDIAGGADKVKQLWTGPTNFRRITANIFVDRKPRKPKDSMVCQCRATAEKEVWELNEDGTDYVKVKKAVGCDENCINRCLYYECDPSTCPMGDKCSNQLFQKGKDFRSLETECRGFGLKTNAYIPKGCLVAEYRGEIISQETCNERMNDMYLDLENYYFLNYDNGEVIDGCRKGTEARFMNHSCDPNCHIEKWYVNGECRIGVFASRDIEPETELSYDYRFRSFGPMQQCRCGSKNCRGFIGINKSAAIAKVKQQEEAAREARRKARTPRLKKNSDGEEKEKKFFRSTKVMLPYMIVYLSPTDMRAKFRRTLREATIQRNELRESNLFLYRNLRGTLTLELRSVAGTIPPEVPPKPKPTLRLFNRRRRTMAQILAELSGQPEPVALMKPAVIEEVRDDVDDSVLDGSESLSEHMSVCADDSEISIISDSSISIGSSSSPSSPMSSRSSSSGRKAARPVKKSPATVGERKLEQEAYEAQRKARANLSASDSNFDKEEQEEDRFFRWKAVMLPYLHTFPSPADKKARMRRILREATAQENEIHQANLLLFRNLRTSLDHMLRFLGGSLPPELPQATKTTPAIVERRKRSVLEIVNQINTSPRDLDVMDIGDGSI